MQKWHVTAHSLVYLFLVLAIGLLLSPAYAIPKDIATDLKTLDSRDIYKLCDDPKTPTEVLDWIVDNNKSTLCYRAHLSNPNLSSKSIEAIFNDYQENSTPQHHQNVYQALVLHPNTKAKIREKIIDMALTDTKAFSNIISTIARQSGELTDDAEKLLRTITHSKYQELRQEAARSPRLPNDLLEHFLATEEIHIRQHLAYNPKLSLEQLTRLANDKYQPVKTAAIFALKDRFPNQYKKIKASLSPEAGSLAIYSLQHELGEAIKSKNLKQIDRLILTIKKYHLQPSYNLGAGAAIKTNDEDLVKIILESFPSHYRFYLLAEDENFNEHWLNYFHQNNHLEQFSDFEIMSALVKNKRWDLYGLMLVKGYDANPIDPKNNRSLYSNIIFSPTVLFLSPIVIPLAIIFGCIIYVFTTQRKDKTISLVLISSLIFLPAMALWFIAIGLGCWGCSNPFGTISLVLLLYISLMMLYIFLYRFIKKRNR